MQRRQFIQSSALASTLLLVPKFLHALDRPENQLAARLRDAPGGAAKRLIVVQLGGGNDGLNTLVPYRNDLYYKARPTLALRAADGLLPLGDELALHPAMKGLKGLYDQGQVAICNAVGYPNPDRSHFRSMDIWQTGSGSEQLLSTGWLGRYLDSTCAGGAPAYQALEIDDTLSLALKGAQRNGLALKNPGKFHQLTQSRYLNALSQEKWVGPAGSELDYLYKTLAETASSADYLYEKSKIYTSAGAYPNTDFGHNLKTTAELITSGVESRVYYLALSGFDTHVRQHEQQGRLLGELSNGLAALAADLQQHNEWNNTLVMVFSEFGRRVGQNASNGTDHGTANNVFLLSGALRKPGLLNQPASLADLDQGDLRYQLDFRSLYASILTDWLGADGQLVLGPGVEKLAGLV
ncbi:DUF1501 domain-containing protein [Hymenobacter sp. UV11]|uniref:DUF1501 domain-containing protein n=1 Tax=Hymenobacter sp. UV11 TaxID=1849735 RepID=UPI00105CB085|nr:DUF1501 domain-containing protein [Hymenobacter sp. UV11]TDN39744.1 twin-arginine translocation pathway signal [Hymenobacter sp. UV11]TFZ67137.1 DUF1501 domain-containing protein [Hymenobacter sp. UV11]